MTMDMPDAMNQRPRAGGGGGHWAKNSLQAVVLICRLHVRCGHLTVASVDPDVDCVDHPPRMTHHPCPSAAGMQSKTAGSN